MNEELSREWLVEIFITYQEAIDRSRKASSPMWLKDALKKDREKNSSNQATAAVFDAL